MRDVGSATREVEGGARRDDLFRRATAEFGPLLDRVAAGYEADPDKRNDLRQEIHFGLWRSFAVYDGRCSLKTWSLRVAHNTAVSYVSRESRRRARFVSLEELDAAASVGHGGVGEIDRQRALEHLYQLIHGLKPLDRQVMLCWLEGLDAASISEITGLKAANAAVKIHRVKNLLAKRLHEERQACPSHTPPGR
jgi:RNA polymerase sigma-70 factor (ECF subfamily)